jgi:inorganic pyrophosphatase
MCLANPKETVVASSWRRPQHVTSATRMRWTRLAPFSATLFSATLFSATLLAAALFLATPLAQTASRVAPAVLPATAVSQLERSLKAAEPHARHVWRDTPPVSGDGTVNAYVEISRGDRRKWEFDIGANVRAIDRMMPEALGGYPVNYGYVPQTISYDGDPFDVLVLGPALPGGTLVRGAIVGLLQMEDEKGLDSKVVVTPLTPAGEPAYALTAADQRRIADFFRRYKEHEPGAFSKVGGWGTAADGHTFIAMTRAFFRECRSRAAQPCSVQLPRSTK